MDTVAVSLILRTRRTRNIGFLKYERAKLKMQLKASIIPQDWGEDKCVVYNVLSKVANKIIRDINQW